jgi:maleylacetoacetate isomerase
MDMYGFWRSQATFRVRVALNVKSIAYREIPIDLDSGGQDQAAFHAINPMGGVPALVVDGAPLIQSLAILEYIEETHPEPPLLPSDPIGRARVRSLAAIAASDSHPLIVPRIKRYLTEHAGFDAAQWKAWQAQWIGTGLRGYEARLTRDGDTGAFCHGDRVSFADICLVGLAAGAKTFAIEVTGIPTVDRIVAACQALPAFDRAKASNQPDYPG